MIKSFLFGKGVENIDSNIYDFTSNDNNVIICDKLLEFLYSDKFNKSNYIFVNLFDYKVGHVWDYHIEKYIKNPWEGLSDNIPYYVDKDKFWSSWHKFCYHEDWLLWKTIQSIMNMYFLLKNKTENFIIFDFVNNVQKSIEDDASSTFPFIADPMLLGKNFYRQTVRYTWDNNYSMEALWQKVQRIIDKDKFILVKSNDDIRGNINAKTLLLR